MTRPLPSGATPVYIATPRRGITAHQIRSANSDSAACGRSTRTGVIVTAQEAGDVWEVTWCDAGCWPAPGGAR